MARQRRSTVCRIPSKRSCSNSAIQPSGNFRRESFSNPQGCETYAHPGYKCIVNSDWSANLLGLNTLIDRQKALDLHLNPPTYIISWSGRLVNLRSTCITTPDKGNHSSLALILAANNKLLHSHQQ